MDDGSDGYFDYGKFEKAASPAPLPPSPADAAVKKVKRKLSQKDLMNFMRDHLEGTELDMSQDAGAGPLVPLGYLGSLSEML